MYVSELTVDMGEKGRKALIFFTNEAEKGLIPACGDTAHLTSVTIYFTMKILDLFRRFRSGIIIAT